MVLTLRISSGDFKLRSETKKTITDYMCDPRICCPLVQTFRFWIEVCKLFLSYSHTWPLYFTNLLPPTQNAPHKWAFCVLSRAFPHCFELNRQLLLAEIHWGGSREWHASLFSSPACKCQVFAFTCWDLLLCLPHNASQSPHWVKKRTSNCGGKGGGDNNVWTTHAWMVH